jgi:putative membrane protein
VVVVHGTVAQAGIGNMKFSQEAKDKIENAIAEAEKKTAGEIVPVIFSKSDNYPASHFRLAILFALSASMILYFLPIYLPDPVWLLWIQIPGLLLGYLFAFHPKLKKFFTTKAEIKEEVHQRAVEVFFERGLHTTRDHTGILIYVSLLERRVEILADTGINAKVEEGTWDNILARLLESIKSDQLVDGLCKSVHDCGEILAVHFPIKEDDTDELSNKLVTDENESSN